MYLPELISLSLFILFTYCISASTSSITALQKYQCDSKKMDNQGEWYVTQYETTTVMTVQ